MIGRYFRQANKNSNFAEYKFAIAIPRKRDLPIDIFKKYETSEVDHNWKIFILIWDRAFSRAIFSISIQNK